MRSFTSYDELKWSSLWAELHLMPMWLCNNAGSAWSHPSRCVTTTILSSHHRRAHIRLHGREEGGTRGKLTITSPAATTTTTTLHTWHSDCHHRAGITNSGPTLTTFETEFYSCSSQFCWESCSERGGVENISFGNVMKLVCWYQYDLGFRVQWVQH